MIAQVRSGRLDIAEPQGVFQEAPGASSPTTPALGQGQDEEALGSEVGQDRDSPSEARVPSSRNRFPTLALWLSHCGTESRGFHRQKGLGHGPQIQGAFTAKEPNPHWGPVGAGRALGLGGDLAGA